MSCPPSYSNSSNGKNRPCHRSIRSLGIGYNVNQRQAYRHTRSFNVSHCQPFARSPSEHLDENRACRSAANQARTTAYSPVADELDKHQWLHPWSYTAGGERPKNHSTLVCTRSVLESLESDQQLAGMLRSLQPLLAHALKKPSLDSSWNVIDGPLTWKSFHQLLHEQSQHAHLDEQISGPQPIPYVLAGLERESIMLAPYGLKFWDKLGLEPYAKRKDIVYIAVLPDNDYICAMTKIYLRELSTQYELCRLGLHRSFSKEVADHGLLRLSDSSNDLFDAAPTLPFVDPWFTDHETSHPLGGRLKLYAQLLQCKLGKSNDAHRRQ